MAQITYELEFYDEALKYYQGLVHSFPHKLVYKEKVIELIGIRKRKEDIPEKVDFNSWEEVQFQPVAAPPPKVENGPTPTHTLVDIYIHQGHFDKALEILQKLAKLNPQDQRTLEKMAQVEKSIAGDDTGPLNLQDNYMRFLNEIQWLKESKQQR